MKNIEKYANTKDALAAYNAIKLKKVPFDIWLECEFEEPRIPTLMEAAQEVANDKWYSELPNGTPVKIIVAIRHLSDAIAREKCKPVRNCDKYKTAEEAYEGFVKFCDKSSCCKCRFARNSSTCALSWLYEKAGEVVMK